MKILFLGDCKSGLLNGILQHDFGNYIKIYEVWTLCIVIVHSFQGSIVYLRTFNYKSYWNENKTCDASGHFRAAWNIGL